MARHTTARKIVKPESPLPEAVLFIAGAVGLIGQRQATQRAIDAATTKDKDES